MKINNDEYTIGADPEIFVGFKETKEPICAHNLVPGNKYVPFPVNKGAVQVDGMALEFNINPSESFDDFKSNLDTVKNILHSMLPDHLDFIEDPSVIFSEELMKSVPFEATMLGCDPDFNAYTDRKNPRPSATNNMRTAGGHLHVGGKSLQGLKNKNKTPRLARLLDEEVGVYSILWDDDDKRREMYGLAGTYRRKPYGMEYRTLSNKWIFKPELVKFVYKGVERALEKLDSDYEPPKIIPNIINSSDRENLFFKGNKLVEQVMAA